MPKIVVEVLRKEHLPEAFRRSVESYRNDRRADGSPVYPVLQGPPMPSEADFERFRLPPGAVKLGAFITEATKPREMAGAADVMPLPAWLSSHSDLRESVFRQVLPVIRAKAPGIRLREIASPGNLAVFEPFKGRGVGPMLHRQRLAWARASGRYRAALVGWVEGAKSEPMIRRTPGLHVVDAVHESPAYGKMHWAFVVFWKR